MKSAIYLGKEAIEIADVLIQNLYSSICGTDAAIYFHDPGTEHKVDIGGEFGHETISRIVKVGNNISEFKVGTRAASMPQIVSSFTTNRIFFFTFILHSLPH